MEEVPYMRALAFSFWVAIILFCVHDNLACMHYIYTHTELIKVPINEKVRTVHIMTRMRVKLKGKEKND